MSIELNPHATELIFHTPDGAFLVHSTTRNAPCIHMSHDSILELWQTFPKALNGYFRQTVKDLVECSIMLHYIRVRTVC